MEKGSGAEAAVGKRPAEPTTTAPTSVKKPNVTASSATTSQQLQQQIQQQLQQQLQAQLQAAAARGQQANITPEQIQAQAQAMVQAAAQAQAVVAAAKSRGDGLVPMNAAQIAALSQIQAQAIVNARKAPGTPQQVQTQIQLQAQALVHAHTQAQIQAGIYKGDTTSTANNNNNCSNNNNTSVVKDEKSASTAMTSSNNTAVSSGNYSKAPTSATTAAPAKASPSTAAQQQPTAAAAAAAPPATITLSHAQVSEQQELQHRQSVERQGRVQTGATPTELQHLDQEHARQLEDLHDTFRRAAGIYPDGVGSDLAQVSSNSPQFLEQLNSSLNHFWRDSLEQIQTLHNQSEQDFKNHNDLPLARIKRIMKSDEDVRMISAEAPVLFAKACELFILDLSIRSWNYSQLHKRRTLQKEDVKEAIQKTDIFDFLVDVIQ